MIGDMLDIVDLPRDMFNANFINRDGMALDSIHEWALNNFQRRVESIR